jgi:phosphate transport system substrate-binding protein
MQSKVLSQVIPLLASLVLLAVSCAKTPTKEEGAAPAAAPAGSVAQPSSGPVTLQGSGASFPAPIYSRWFREFSDKNSGIRVNYQATGSGAGIKAFVEGQTDFGASDAAMTDEEITQAQGNVVLLPVTAGNIVLAYNLEGVTGLKLSREAYAGIFLGKIKKWNDPVIAKANAGTKLPDKDVTVAHRSDGSGTTFVFTQHLSAINADWKTKPGKGTSVDWPVGVGGRKNDGVAALIAQTPGSIGYVEYAFAVGSKMPMAALENKAGKFVEPSLEASRKALAAVTLPEDMRAWVTDPEGEEAYPIVTYTWILAKKKYTDPAKADALKKLLSWCLTDGQKLSEELHYVALPEPVAQQVGKAVATIQ